MSLRTVVHLQTIIRPLTQGGVAQTPNTEREVLSSGPSFAPGRPGLGATCDLPPDRSHHCRACEDQFKSSDQSPVFVGLHAFSVACRVVGVTFTRTTSPRRLCDQVHARQAD